MPGPYTAHATPYNHSDLPQISSCEQLTAIEHLCALLWHLLIRKLAFRNVSGTAKRIAKEAIPAP